MVKVVATTETEISRDFLDFAFNYNQYRARWWWALSNESRNEYIYSQEDYQLS